MDGVIRQLYDYDGSNLFPRTKPNAFVSDLQDSDAVGIRTIGERIDTSIPSFEPEFVYRVKGDNITSENNGELYATKISDFFGNISGAVLTASLTVSNGVGNASLGRTYPAGTYLEDIIRDMLAGGVSVYDVAKTLVSVQFSSVEVNGSSVSNNGIINIDSGSATISFRTTYADGYFYPSNNYPQDRFRTLHEGQRTYNQNNNILYADSSPNSLKITNDNSIEYNADLSTLEALRSNGNIEVSKQINITSGNQRFVITLNCAAQPNYVKPYKSNGTLSNQSISDSSFQYTFTVIGSGVTVYDVKSPINPVLSNNFDVDSGGGKVNIDIPFKIDVYDNTYKPNNSSTPDFVIKSKYDIEHQDQDISTGVWTGDSAIIFTKKYLYPDWNYEYHLNNTDGGVISIESPGFVYNDGIFNREDDYDFELFKEKNDKVTNISGNLYAECIINQTPILGIYRNDTSIKTINASYGSVTKKQNYHWVNSINNLYTIYFQQFIDFINNDNNGVLDMGNDIFETSGNYNLKFILPYSNNTVIPIKSNGEQSSKNISAGNKVIQSNSFEVKQEADVSANYPYIDSPIAEINGYPEVYYYDNSSIPYNNWKNQTLLFIIKYYDGYYGPDSIWMQQENPLTEFNNINNTTGARLDSSNYIENINLQIKKGNQNINTEYNIENDGFDIWKIYLPLASIENDINNSSISFTFSGTYEDSPIEPKKRSTRPSNVTIPSGTTQPRTITLFFQGEQTVSKTLIINNDNNGLIRYKKGNENYSDWGVYYTINVVPNTWVTVDAKPNDDYIFDYWRFLENGAGGGSIVNDSEYEFRMPNVNCYATAHFKQQVTESRTLEIYPIPSGEDDCSVNYRVNNGIWTNLTNQNINTTIAYNSSVTVKAHVGEGYQFSGWYNHNTRVNGYLNTEYTFTMNEDKALDAIFEQVSSNTSHVMVKSNSSDGSVRIANSGINNGEWSNWTNSSISYDVDKDSSTSVEARANDGYAFDKWDCYYNGNNTIDKRSSFYIDATPVDCSWIASFVPLRTLNIILDGFDGSVRYQTKDSGSSAWNNWSEYYNQSTTVYIKDDSSVNIQANTESGYRFVNWVNPDNNNTLSSNNPYEFRILNDSSIKAISEETFSTTKKLTLYAINGNGNKVRINNSIANLSVSQDIIVGDDVSIWAIPNEGYRFVHWVNHSTNNFISSDNPFEFPMPNEDYTLDAIFTQIPSHTVTVNTDGHGTVKICINGVWSNNWEDSISEQVQEGTTVTVDASPNEGYTFEYWDNIDVQNRSTNTQFSFTMPTNNVTLTAHFTTQSVQPTARLLTTKKVLITDTNQLLNTITSIDDILENKVSGVDEWFDTVSPTISEDVTIPLSSTESYGVDNDNNSRTIVAIVPAEWNIKNIELQNPAGLNNGFFDRASGAFDSSTSTVNNEFTYTVDNLSYKVYAKKNPNRTPWLVSQIVFKKSE